jgi:hypothetical protein
MVTAARLPQMPLRLLCAFAVSQIAFTAAGCGQGARATAARAEALAGSIQFVDVAASLGVRFKHSNGAAGRFYLAETMGSGCAFLDYDNDGRLDLYLVNSSPLPGFTGEGPFHPALYRQRPDARFEDVTRRAGLAVETYGTGVAVGDYDNDGDPDLYLTALGSNRLHRNNGDGTFSDVTARARVGDSRWGSSAAWFDYDRDGNLDLFVGNYCDWSPDRNRRCGDDSGPYICGPKYYPGTSSRLYRNNGDGTFVDVTRVAGVDAPDGKALGVVVWDHDGDGWLDFAVANDTTPNWLFRNNRDGTFTEVGVETGIAYSNTGLARAGMGIDTVDDENSGREAILIGNNTMEGLAFYRPSPADPVPGAVHFLDQADEARLLESSLPFSTFGALGVDVDLDGFPDLVTANGHVNEHVARLGGMVRFDQRMQLFHNEAGDAPGTRRFRDIAEQAGPGVAARRVGRGLAVGDVDSDGDPDLLVTANNGRAALLRNEGTPRHHWLALRPRGVRSNREGLGTRVRVRTAGRWQTGWVRSGSSYCSDSEHLARFGLGDAAQADIVELRWPSGAVQELRNVRADQVLTVTEPSE